MTVILTIVILHITMTLGEITVLCSQSELHKQIDRYWRKLRNGQSTVNVTLTNNDDETQVLSVTTNHTSGDPIITER